MNTREWHSGHRKSTTNRHHNRPKKRQRHAPPLQTSSTTPLALRRRPDPNMLLDPMVGPLMMAKPDEAEYLLSRHPSHVMSPYQRKKSKKAMMQNKNRKSKRNNKRNNNNNRNNRNNSNNKNNKNNGNKKNLPALAHSRSATTTTTNQGMKRLQSLHGGGNGKVTMTHRELDSKLYQGGSEFRVVQAILKREHVLRALQKMVSTSNTRPYFATDAIYMVLDLCALAVDCIESIAEWRKPHSKVFNFMWEDENYLLKMYKDTSFLKVCRPLGLCLSLPGLPNNPLLDFDDQIINTAEVEYNSAWAKFVRRDINQSIDFDPVEVIKSKNDTSKNDHLRRVELPVMLVHAQHVIQDELRRLNLKHDQLNSKLIPTEEYKQNMQDQQDEARRDRITVRRLEFELLKKRQNERDRKGFETEEDEKKSMTSNEWIPKKKKEMQEEKALKKKHAKKVDQNSYLYKRNKLLTLSDRYELKKIETENNQLLQKLRQAEQDEKHLIEKTRRLELSLRSISQEGLLPQMMTDHDVNDTKETIRNDHNSSSNRNTRNSKSGNVVLERLLEESNLQDFVGGWRLRRLRSECESVHARVELLRKEMKLRVDDYHKQKEKMNHAKKSDEAKKKKKEKIRQKLLEERTKRLAKGLKNKNMGTSNDVVISDTSNRRKDKQSSSTTAKQNQVLENAVVGGIGKMSSILLKALKEQQQENMSLKESQELDRILHHAEIVRSNGVYPHASMLVAPQSRAEGVIGGALPVMHHGGCYGVSVVNHGIFLSRKVIVSPSIKKRRSIVAQRSSMMAAQEDHILCDRTENIGSPSAAATITTPIPSPAQLSPHRLWLAQKERKHVRTTKPAAAAGGEAGGASTSSASSSSSPSSLKKYAPYMNTEDQERRDEILKKDKAAYEKQQIAMIKLAKLKYDWLTKCLEHSNVWQHRGIQSRSSSRHHFRNNTTLGTPTTPATPATLATPEHQHATSLPGSAASGLYSTLSLPSAVSGMTFEPTPSSSMPFFTFVSKSKSPIVVISYMFDVPNLLRFQYMVSKKLSKMISKTLKAQLPFMTIENRIVQWIKPILAEKADSAREALAFTRASLRSLQSLDPSDGDALFLAHASRDVAARRVVDALQLLSIRFGSEVDAASTTTAMAMKTNINKNQNKKNQNNKITSHQQRRQRQQGTSVATVSSTPMKMGWDTVVASLSEFDKTTIGPVIFKSLKPMVKQLRLDIARRTENAVDDSDISPSLRAAKIIGTWLGSIIRWKDDYEGSLTIIELLSIKKSTLEQRMQEVLGVSVL